MSWERIILNHILLRKNEIQRYRLTFSWRLISPLVSGRLSPRPPPQFPPDKERGPGLIPSEVKQRQQQVD